jgi:hypothetical protein
LGFATSTVLVASFLAVRRSQWAWTAAAVVMFIGPPRIVLSYLGFLAPAVVLTLRERDR